MFVSLANLSLVLPVHGVLWQPEYIEVLLTQLRELKTQIEQEAYEASFRVIRRNQTRYLSSLRALTNCLVSN